MFPSKFTYNEYLPSAQSSLSSLNSVSSCSYVPVERAELYPRRRPTEFYYNPQPMEEYQSRSAEHPNDKLKRRRSSRYELETIAEESPRLRINPPKNSDMRMFRNSYFS